MTNRADIEADIAAIRLQQEKLQFPHFNEDDAWELGLDIHGRAKRAEQSIVIDIRLWDRRLFWYAMPGATFDNEEWVRRKINLVRRFHMPSYLFGRLCLTGEKTIDDDAGITLLEHAAHGGSFPICIRKTGAIGAVTVSGLPQRDDHNLVVAAIADHLDIDEASVALGEESG